MGIVNTVALILQGEDQGAAEALSGVAGGLGGLNGSLATFAGGAAVAGVAALGAIGVAAFNTQQDFDQAMNLFQARTGTAQEDLQAFGDVATDIFTNNWGDSLTDVADAMSTVQQMTGAGADEVGALTQNALIMRDVFGTDVAESTLAAKTLMEEFGLLGQQAFDFITFGMQQGLNSSGDFLDSIGEYSNLFADSGFSAETFFSIMETGAAGGVLGTDKVADAIKEMGIILAESGDEAHAAFETMGLDLTTMSEQVAGGQATWADFFPEIISGLNAIEDPIVKNQAQVAIFGTMAEDLGVSFTEGLSVASTSLAEMEGATTAAGEAVSQGLGPAWETFKKQAEVALLPLGGLIADMLTALTPHLITFGEFLSDFIPLAAETMRVVVIASLEALNEGILVWQGIAANAGVAWELFSGQVQEKWDAASAFVQGALQQVDEEIETWRGIFENAGAAWELFTGTVQDKWDAASAFVQAAMQQVDEGIEAWRGIFESAGAAWELFTGQVSSKIDEAQARVDSALTTVNGTIETWQGAFESGVAAWESGWESVKGAASSAKSALEPIFSAVRSFANWLSGHVFNFSFNLPDLPDWAVPGSPIPLHTAWKDYHQFLAGNVFRPQFDLEEANVSEVIEPTPVRPVFRSGAAVSEAANISSQQTAPTRIYHYYEVTITDERSASLFLDYLDTVQSQAVR